MIDYSLHYFLNKRKEESRYRSLQVQKNLIDFCSNDYLSLARSERIKATVHKFIDSSNYLLGSTGSRSISGNTTYVEELEKKISNFHNSEAALLFNSGYDANLGLFSCIAQKGDTIITDELIHASIIDGCRLSYANRYKFLHNNLSDLEQKLKCAKGNVFVAVESVYSMDGDFSPLIEIANLCSVYNANLIVDEAHATGIFGRQGRGVVFDCGIETKVFARVHTLGKAIGSHGAVVLGSNLLREYLINTSRSFIFTTALPMHTLVTINAAYDELLNDKVEILKLHNLINQFRFSWMEIKGVTLIDSLSPIQCVIIPGNDNAKRVAKSIQDEGFDVRAILSPSVPIGKERLRISIHTHNTNNQIYKLLLSLNKAFYL